MLVLFSLQERRPPERKASGTQRPPPIRRDPCSSVGVRAADQKQIVYAIFLYFIAFNAGAVMALCIISPPAFIVKCQKGGVGLICREGLLQQLPVSWRTAHNGRRVTVAPFKTVNT